MCFRLGQHTREDLTDDLGNLMKLKADAKSDPIGQDEIYPLLQVEYKYVQRKNKCMSYNYQILTFHKH